MPNGAAFCPNCSTQVGQQQNAYQGQQQMYPGGAVPNIPNYLVWAMLLHPHRHCSHRVCSQSRWVGTGR
ncbi:MAG: hypothetical protein ACM3UZ_02940 [Acidobacteriota bacterium]